MNHHHQKKYKIQIIGRGAYFKRVCKHVKEKLEPESNVTCLAVPEMLPSFIDAPENLISLNDLNDPDLLFCAPNHPDLALHLAELAVEAEVDLLVYGCTENLSINKGLAKQIETICHGNIRVFMPPTMCALTHPPADNIANNPFFRQFGFPKFKISRKNNERIDISFEHGAICGSTEIVVNALIRHQIPLEKLKEKAGLFVQTGCLAGGEGTQEGSIYKGAKVHAKAMENALAENSEDKK